MIQYFKLVRNGLITTSMSLALFGQATQKKNHYSQSQSWPPKNAVTAAWERVEADTGNLRHKKSGPGLTENVHGASAYFTGKFKGKTFILRYVHTTAMQNGNGSLLLSIGGKEQVFTVVSQTWRLLWAGDADNDGELDLIIESTGDGGGSSSDLYLSSLAQKAELLRFSKTLVSEDGC